MIVAIKNNQVIGVDKELLDLLNTNLENLSQKINVINLAFASIKENPLIEIEGKNFEVKEIEFINLENIKLFNLNLQTEPVENKEEFNLNLQTEPTENKEEFNLNLQTEPTENKEEFNLNLQTEPTENKGPIKLYFEDEFSEIDELLELNKKEVNEKLNEELKKAAQELNIDLDTINELFEELLNQIKENEEKFKIAIANKDYEQLHKIAHSLKGASLNLRLANLGLILKYIDEKSKEKIPIEQIEMLVNKFYNFVNKISNQEEFIQDTQEIDENVKNLIIETINNYLETNNERKFKKDLKYIRKLLNKEVNSLEDLQNLIKGEQ